MDLPIISVSINQEYDIVAARQRARQLAQLLGFDGQDQTRIATAVSEIARNAFTYAHGGKVEFSIEGKTAPQVLLIRVADQGPGIENLKEILAGRYRSSTGMGMGLLGARRLMDQFNVESIPGRGTTVNLRKLFPKKAPLVTPAQVKHLVDELVHPPSSDPLAEIQLQNQELLRTLDELRKRQEELLRLNHELEDTNRGVVALYAELDEKADHLRRADELKSRFLSNMSHEFRTPLNSIMALSRMLVERTDGPLTFEQEKQVSFIRKAAQDLAELVNDLLDLAKVEAGKTVIHPTEFQAANLFGALRGMLRPLLVNESVNLVFEEPQGIPPLYTDEAKVSQILRNFISNALKFTERGQVYVSARLNESGADIVFQVADTGIGIAAEDRDRIFQEFTQLDNPMQRRVKGTGLGLPLSKKLAELLGGKIEVQSEPGVGSTFSVTVPLLYVPPRPEVQAPTVELVLDEAHTPVLVVEDAPEDLLMYQRFLQDSPFQMIPAHNLRQARQALIQFRPQAIILDILLRGEDAWGFLSELKSKDSTRSIPILVVSSIDDPRKGLGLGAEEYRVKPVERHWLLPTLERLTGREAPKRILIIEDEEAFRYVLQKYLAATNYLVVEASSGIEGLALALQDQPDLILLDLKLPDLSGAEVLRRLKKESLTREIPVIIITSRLLPETEFNQLSVHARAVFSKANLTRELLVQTIRQPSDPAPLPATA